MNNKDTSLSKLFLCFAKVGVMTFGGGYAMLPILQREVVETNKFATDEELLNYFAVGQCTPGIIAVNTATFIGHKKRGIPGAIAATLGVITPSIIIILILAGILNLVSSNVYVAKAFAGIRIAVVSLILISIYKVAKKSVKDFETALFAVLAFVVTAVLGLTPTLVVLFSIIYGIIRYLLGKNKGGSEK